jgi:hypothetical protein
VVCCGGGGVRASQTGCVHGVSGGVRAWFMGCVVCGVLGGMENASRCSLAPSHPTYLTQSVEAKGEPYISLSFRCPSYSLPDPCRRHGLPGIDRTALIVAGLTFPVVGGWRGGSLMVEVGRRWSSSVACNP